MNALDLAGVKPERHSGCALDHIHAARVQHQRDHRTPRALTAREALVALQFEALLVYVAAANLRNGVQLSADDMDRLTIAVRRIDIITDEAAG